MTDARKLHPKPGQHLGKRVRNPKKTPKRSAMQMGTSRPTLRSPEPLAAWERELLGIGFENPSRRKRR